jgi:hypothetical protein
MPFGCGGTGRREPVTKLLQQRAQRAVGLDAPWGENVPLRVRVDAYFDRMRDGHVVAGRVPGPDALEMWSNDYLGLIRKSSRRKSTL